MNPRPILHLIRELSPKADKLREVSPAFRLAAEAYEGATMYGCGGDLLSFLWSLVVREAKVAEGLIQEARE